MKYALEHGIIDLSDIQKQIDMSKRREYLEKHHFKIWQGENGKWYTYLSDEVKGRRLIKRNSQTELEDVVVDYWKTQMENPTLNEVFEEWNDRRLSLAKISPATHLRYTQVYNRHFQEFGQRRIKNVEAEEIGDFLEEQIFEHMLSAKGFASLKTIARGFLKRAKKRKLISFNVEQLFQELDVSDIDFKKVIKEDYQEVFDEEEMPLIMEYLTHNRSIKHLGLLLMFVTGARIGEIVALKKSDFEENTFKVRRTETRYLKDGKYVNEIKEYPKTDAGVRIVIVPLDYVWVIDELLNRDVEEYIFENDGERLSTQALRMRLRKVCKKLHIYQKSPHKIRKTYGSILMDNHVDQLTIIKQMGHTDISCTERHYHRNRRTIQRKTEILSAIPELKAE